ncbi:hypothetical protein Droror1_Dr00022530 [Drosera rotundifolia]
MTKFSQISTTALLFFIAFIICLQESKLESSSPPDISSDTSDEGFSTGITIGVALGVLLWLAIRAFLACGCWKQQQKDDAPLPSEAEVIGPSAADGTKTLKRYTMEELSEMTNNFDAENLLGKGGSESVYRGQGSDGTKVAIKRIDMSRAQGTQDYVSEFSALARISHGNIVSLFGHFRDQNERFLVFEYAPQGMLESRLFHCQEKGFEPLSWKQRLTIALDVARGLE